MRDIDLRCCSADQLLASLPRETADLVHVDAPWSYSKAAPPGHGRAGEHYGGLPTYDIARTVAAAGDVARGDAYLLMWLTWPLLEDYVEQHVVARRERPAARSWRQLSGGSWGKTDARRGIGHHLLGDTEPLLVYRQGDPKPQAGPISNDWRSPRRGHSAKPVPVLTELVRWGCRPGGLVLDLYAGESGSLARACMLTGRRYLGCEIDPTRHAKALRVLADCDPAAPWGPE